MKLWIKLLIFLFFLHQMIELTETVIFHYGSMLVGQVVWTVEARRLNMQKSVIFGAL